MIEKQRKMKKEIFYFGAGIDINSPTSFPSGYELTGMILYDITPESILKSLFQLDYDTVNDYVKKIYKNEISPRPSINKKIWSMMCEHYHWPRLEAVIEAIRMIDENHIEAKENGKYLRGLSFFENALLNKCHFYLAKALHQGAWLITTNFDYCVLEAYNKLYNDSNFIKLKLCDSLGLYCYENPDKKSDTGKVYYLHGVSNDLHSIGITLTNLQFNISKAFTETFEKKLSDGAKLHWIGYSGGDSIDLNPYFETLPEYSEAKGIFIRHCSRSDKITIDSKEYTNAERLLLRFFGERKVINTNTEQYLKEYIGNEKFEKEIDSIIKKQEKSNEYWYRAFLKRRSKFSNEDKIAIGVVMTAMFSLNPEKILPPDWIKVELSNKKLQGWVIAYYGQLIGRQLNSEQIINEFQKIYNLDYENQDYVVMSNFYAAKGDIRGAALVFGNLKDVYEFANKILKSKSKCPITWEVSTRVNRWTYYILCDSLQLLDGEVKEGIGEEIYNRMKENRESFVRLLTIEEAIMVKHSRFHELNQRYTAERDYYVLNIAKISSEKIKDNTKWVDEFLRKIEKVAEDYMQISSIHGKAGTLNRYVMACILYGVALQYGASKKNIAIKYYDKAERCLKEVIKMKKNNGLYIRQEEARLEKTVKMLKIP